MQPHSPTLSARKNTFGRVQTDDSGMSYTYEAPYRLAPYAGSLKRKDRILFPSQSLKGLNYLLIIVYLSRRNVNRRSNRQRTFSDRADRFSLAAVIFFGFIADRALFTRATGPSI